jgi:hypothetical protein
MHCTANSHPIVDLGIGAGEWIVLSRLSMGRWPPDGGCELDPVQGRGLVDGEEHMKPLQGGVCDMLEGLQRLVPFLAFRFRQLQVDDRGDSILCIAHHREACKEVRLL